jgi:hypothetical protein
VGALYSPLTEIQREREADDGSEMHRTCSSFMTLPPGVRSVLKRGRYFLRRGTRGRLERLECRTSYVSLSPPLFYDEELIGEVWSRARSIFRRSKTQGWNCLM